MPQYLTSRELADRFRASVNTLYYWRYIGYGPQSIKVGNRRLYPLDEIERFEREQLAEQNPQGSDVA